MLEDFFLFSDGFTIVKMHDKKELQIFFCRQNGQKRNWFGDIYANCK